MYNLSDINDVKQILKKHGFSFSKSFGQNFIVDSSVCPEMVNCAGIEKNDCVIEIGPGIGVLTAELCKSAKSVAAVEVDKRLPEVLSDTLADYKNLKIICGDIMKLDVNELIKKEFDGGTVHICANLPYYITSPVIMKLLEEKSAVKDITVMVQKEAADRLCAEVGTRACGAVTAAVSYYAEAEKCFLVGKESFFPSPKVVSEVIKLKIRKTPLVTVQSEKNFFRIIKGAFAQRRKTVLNSLSSSLNIAKSRVAEALESCGIPSDIRAERLTMQNFADLSDCLMR